MQCGAGAAGAGAEGAHGAAGRRNQCAGRRTTTRTGGPLDPSNNPFTLQVLGQRDLLRSPFVALSKQRQRLSIAQVDGRSAVQVHRRQMSEIHKVNCPNLTSSGLRFAGYPGSPQSERRRQRQWQRRRRDQPSYNYGAAEECAAKPGWKLWPRQPRQAISPIVVGAVRTPT